MTKTHQFILVFILHELKRLLIVLLCKIHNSVSPLHKNKQSLWTLLFAVLYKTDDISDAQICSVVPQQQIQHVISLALNSKEHCTVLYFLQGAIIIHLVYTMLLSSYNYTYIFLNIGISSAIPQKSFKCFHVSFLYSQHEWGHPKLINVCTIARGIATDRGFLHSLGCLCSPCCG